MESRKSKLSYFAGVVLLGLLLMVGLTGCGGTSAAEPEEVLPVKITSNGNSYSINSFEIVENEEGGTTIVCEGNGFNKLPIRNNAMVVPIYCSVIEDGTETKFAMFSVQGGVVEFIFNEVHEPDTIVFYPEDNKEERTEVPVV